MVDCRRSVASVALVLLFIPEKYGSYSTFYPSLNWKCSALLYIPMVSNLASVASNFVQKSMVGVWLCLRRAFLCLWKSRVIISYRLDSVTLTSTYQLLCLKCFLCCLANENRAVEGWANRKLLLLLLCRNGCQWLLDLCRISQWRNCQ